MLLVPLLLHSPHPNPATTLLRRQGNPGKGLKPIQTMQASGSAPTCRWMKECQNGGGNSDLFSTLRASVLATSRSKGWPTGKPWPLNCQPHNGTKMVCGPPHPAWLGQKDYLPLKDFQGAWNYWVVWHQETVALAMALQRCTICLRISPGVHCRVVQELCRCLAPCLRVAISWAQDVGCCEEGPHGPCPCREGLVTKTQSGLTNQCTHP